MSERAIYGVLAELRTADELLNAVKRARAAGYTSVEAYAPFPVDGLSEALGFERNRVPLIALIGGIVGGVGGYFMQWYSAVISYPINVGGRPLHSWPSFIPPTFELTVLGAALFAVFGMILANGLPKLYHPLFNVPDFDLATRNRFFICVPATTLHFDLRQARDFLTNLKPLKVWDVPA